MEFVSVVYYNPNTFKYARIEVMGVEYNVEMWEAGKEGTNYQHCTTKKEAKEVVKKWCDE